MRKNIFVGIFIIVSSGVLYFFKEFLDLDSLNNIFAIAASIVAISAGFGILVLPKGFSVTKTKNAQVQPPKKSG